jgi:ABC-type transport system substrate-binding protein
VPGGSASLTWALNRRPATLDPLYARTTSDLLAARQLHEPLIERLDGPFEEARAVPGLALSARPSADSTVWRLRLRPGVRFQDGARFNASAVLANTDRWLSTPAGRRVLGQLLVDAPRPDLVRFILPRPDPHFDRLLASPRLGIVSPEAIAQAGGRRLDPGRFPDSGTGPFELRERSPDRLLLARNTEWWGAQRGLGPGVDQLELLAVPNPADRLAMLRDGSARVAALGPSQLEAARRDPLLATVPEPGPDGLGIERSVREIPPRQLAPPLNAVWITGIDAG